MDTSMLLAYDVGMNNGDDTEYYLTKGYKVIGIEANPQLCSIVKSRFPNEIDNGNLVVYNVGVGKEDSILSFYIDRQQSTTSTFVPQPNEDGRYEIIPIKVTKLSTIMQHHGIPDLLKIDVEGLDYAVLEDLYMSGIRPLYVSAEAHTIDVFCILICMGYDRFKIIESSKVSQKFTNHSITLLNGQIRNFSFMHNSSGPFGDDVPGDWLCKEAAISSLLSLDTTWRDIHAKNTKQIYLQQAYQAGLRDPKEEIELAYAYWRLYPDVAQDAHYGEYGDLGFGGARRHFEEYGQYEPGRKWPYKADGS